jgi:hypothetical protein
MKFKFEVSEGGETEKIRQEMLIGGWRCRKRKRIR